MLKDSPNPLIKEKYHARDENVMAAKIREIHSSDGKSKVLARKVRKKAPIERPSLIVGFPSAGLVGSISANYVIDTVKMSQVAAVDSAFVVPAVTYVGGKLRHPFRVYVNDKGTLYVMVCDAPIMPEGVYSIMDMILTWVIEMEIGQIIALDGIPVRGFPGKERKPVVLTSYDSSGDGDEPPARRKSESALIAGLSAGLLSACLSRGVPCTAVLVHVSAGIPDPEGAALLIDTVSKMPSVPLELDTSPLVKQGREIKRRLARDLENLRRQTETQERTKPYLGRSRIYG